MKKFYNHILIIINSEIPDVVQIECSHNIKKIETELIGTSMKIYADYEVDFSGELYNSCGPLPYSYFLKSIDSYRIDFNGFLIKQSIHNLNAFQLDKDDAKIILLRHFGRFLTSSGSKHVKHQEDKEHSQKYWELLDKRRIKIRKSLNTKQLVIFEETVLSYKLEKKNNISVPNSLNLQALNNGIEKIIKIEVNNSKKTIGYIDYIIAQLKMELLYLKISKQKIELKELKERPVGYEDFSPLLEYKTKENLYFYVIDVLESLKEEPELGSYSCLLEACSPSWARTYNKNNRLQKILFLDFEPEVLTYVYRKLNKKLNINKENITDYLKFTCNKKSELKYKDWIVLFFIGIFALFVVVSCVQNTSTNSQQCYHKC